MGSPGKNGPNNCPGRLAHIRFWVRVRDGIILDNKCPWSVLSG